MCYCIYRAHECSGIFEMKIASRTLKTSNLQDFQKILVFWSFYILNSNLNFLRWLIKLIDRDLNFYRQTTF